MKKITPNFLKLTIALSFLLISNFLSAQNVDITISVDWSQWARENKIELFAPGGNTPILTVTHPSGYLAGPGSTGASGDTHTAT